MNTTLKRKLEEAVSLEVFLSSSSSLLVLLSSSSCHEKEDAGFMCNFDLWLHASRLLLLKREEDSSWAGMRDKEKRGTWKEGLVKTFSPDCNERSLLNLFVFSLEIPFDCKRSRREKKVDCYFTTRREGESPLLKYQERRIRQKTWEGCRFIFLEREKDERVINREKENLKIICF